MRHYLLRLWAAGNRPPLRSWGQAAWWAGAPGQRLGIDLDQMGALLHAEHREGRGQPPGWGR